LLDVDGIAELKLVRVVEALLRALVLDLCTPSTGGKVITTVVVLKLDNVVVVVVVVVKSTGVASTDRIIAFGNPSPNHPAKRKARIPKPSILPIARKATAVPNEKNHINPLAISHVEAAECSA